MKYYKVLFILFGPIAILGCSKHEKQIEENDNLLIVNQFFSDSFLNKWNSASINYLEQQFVGKETSELSFIIEEFKNDSLNSRGATRRNFLELLRKNNFLKDSIYYNTIYIIELQYSGEYVIKRNYLLINSVTGGSFFSFKSRLGNWEIQESGNFKKMLIMDVDKLFESEQLSGEVEEIVESIIVTKITPKTIISKVIVDPNEQEAELVSKIAKGLIE